MLQRVRIQNFKSLKDVTLDLQKVNLFIGPNNSGKSNFLKALELFGNYIIFSGESSHFIKNDIDFKEYSLKGNKEEIKFEVSIENNKLGIIIQPDGNSKPDYKTLYNDSVFPDSGNSIFNENVRLFTGSLNREVFENIKVYKINPQTFENGQPISGKNIVSEYLLEDGSNIVAFLDRLQGEQKKILKKIQEDLQKCIPEFTDINLKTVNSSGNDQRTYKIWGLGNDNEKYWAKDLSEGVLYFVALLCIVHQPNPPKLLLLEEPEKGIHPRRIHEVMKFIFQLAEDKDIQVIMTSHNEHVLQEFRLNPEAVFIFDKDEEGATFVKNLQKDVIEPDTQKAIEFGVEPH